MTLENLQNACQGNSTVANWAVVAAAVYAVTHYTTTYVRFKDEQTPAQAAGHTPVEKSAGLFAAMVILFPYGDTPIIAAIIMGGLVVSMSQNFYVGCVHMFVFVCNITHTHSTLLLMIQITVCS